MMIQTWTVLKYLYINLVPDMSMAGIIVHFGVMSCFNNNYSTCEESESPSDVKSFQ